MRELLFFDDMLTPKVITVVYWLLLLLVLIGGIGVMIGAPGGFGGFIGGLLAIVIGAVLARIWCEMLIVVFKLNEALQTYELFVFFNPFDLELSMLNCN